MVEIINTSGGTVRHRGVGRTFEPRESDDVPDEVASHLIGRHGFERVGDEDEDSGDDTEDLTALDGVGDSTADDLTEAGFETLADVRDATAETLTDASEHITDDLAATLTGDGE